VLISSACFDFYLKVQRLWDGSFLHLGGKRKARHGEQLRHPSLAFLKNGMGNKNVSGSKVTFVR
jgi:hypothetical protein